ncbi:unnamed protein product [Clavelina lepadiformis]|uniref:Uncharacterized protein n=1 Tax=Clavelina lepadiformis TaxID=159417 RepID=A0ABP0FC13_CLALP
MHRGKKEKTTKKRKLNDAKGERTQSYEPHFDAALTYFLFLESPAIEGDPPSRNQLKKQIRKAKKEKRMKIEKSKDIVNNGFNKT